MLKNAVKTRITKGLSWPSQATIIAVKPTPLATPVESVKSVPVTWSMPAMPEIAPLRTIVTIITRFTLMPAYRAVAWLSPTTLIS